ncbi:MAG: hypothetical protein KBS55_02645 [Bacteroidales bacterium]|nr:hypothetical protein [Candidatus Cryptobacteroides aphodequi]
MKKGSTYYFLRPDATVTEGLALVESRLAEINKGDTVLLEFGCGDCDYQWSQIAAFPMLHHKPNTDLDQFSAYYGRIIGIIKSVGARPVVLSLPPLDAENFFNDISRGMDSVRKANLLSWLGGDICSVVKLRETYNQCAFALANAAGVEFRNVDCAFSADRS